MVSSRPLPSGKQWTTPRRRPQAQAPPFLPRRRSAGFEHTRYDVNDQRIEKKVDADGNGTWDSAVKTVYDGENPYADFDINNNLTNRYVYGNAVDQLFARIENDGDIFWHLTDRLGSVRQIADVGTRVALDTLTYDSFGNILSESNPSTGDRFKYTSREWDSEIGLQYNRARYYDPRIGRWIREDPIRERSGDLNFYRYVNNMPVNATDPSGKIAWLTDLIQAYADGLTSAVDAYNRGGRDLVGNIIRSFIDGFRNSLIQSATFGAAFKAAGSGLRAIKSAAGGIIDDYFWRPFGFVAEKVKFWRHGPIDPNKLHHIFGKAGHNLGPLLNQFGGNQEAVFHAVRDAAQAVVDARGIVGVFDNLVVNVRGVNVKVRGNVIDDNVHIGTFFS